VHVLTTCSAAGGWPSEAEEGPGGRVENSTDSSSRRDEERDGAKDPRADRLGPQRTPHNSWSTTQTEREEPAGSGLAHSWLQRFTWNLPSRLGSIAKHYAPAANPYLEGNMPDDLDEVAGPDNLEDIDDEVLEELDAEADLVDPEADLVDPEDVVDIDDFDALEDDEAEDDVLVVVVPEEAVVEAEADGEVIVATAVGAERPATAEAEAEEEDEEEPEDEDVEASLDVILKERLVVEDEPEDDDEPTDAEDRSEISERVLPKQADEFVCRSCFLVKHSSQLADKRKRLCRDCV